MRKMIEMEKSLNDNDSGNNGTFYILAVTATLVVVLYLSSFIISNKKTEVPIQREIVKKHTDTLENL